MRKDGKSQYQLKKDKLLKIKKIVERLNLIDGFYYEEELSEKSPLMQIWEIIKNEKDND